MVTEHDAPGPIREVHRERARIIGHGPRFFQRDLAGHHPVGEATLERQHSVASARLERIGDLRRLPLTNQRRHGVRHTHHLDRGQAPGPARARQKLLHHDRTERLGELDANMRLPLRGHGVDDPLDRRRGRPAMHRRQDEMTRLGRRQGQRDRLGIAHLAHQKDVGVLAERVAQAAGEVGDVAPDLAPPDNRRLAGGEPVLDRVFERREDDRLLPERLLRERRQRRRLARPGCATDQHQPVRQLHEILERQRHQQRGEEGGARGSRRTAAANPWVVRKTCARTRPTPSISRARSLAPPRATRSRSGASSAIIASIVDVRVGVETLQAPVDPHHGRLTVGEVQIAGPQRRRAPHEVPERAPSRSPPPRALRSEPQAQPAPAPRERRAPRE